MSPLHLGGAGLQQLGLLDTPEDFGCIINSPCLTMAHPLIGFEAEKTADAVLEVATMPADARAKPVIAIARGMGGGKTRVLETLRRILMQRDGALPLAITFNTNSPLDFDSWLKDAKGTGSVAVEHAYCVSLAARMVSAVLGIKYAKVANIFNANFPSLDRSSVNDSPTEIIRDTVRFLVDRVNAARAQQTPPATPISTVVVLLDESRKMDEFTGSTDLGGLTRIALLNDPIAPGLSAALVFSDLGFLEKDLRSTSGREVMILELPARLNPARVVNEWWGRDAPTRNLTPETQFVLEVAAATMNNMPRALEIADDFLRMGDNANRPVDPALLLELFQYVFGRARGKYGPITPSEEVLSAMFFREPVPLDDRLYHAISRSVVTNPITVFSPGSQIVPEASLVLLKVLSLLPDASPNVKLIGDGISSVINVLAPDPNTNKPRPTGDVLEEAGLQALRSRLALARDMDDMTLARLCGVSSSGLLSGMKLATRIDEFKLMANAATVAVMFAPLKVRGYYGVVDKLSFNSYKKKAAFLTELDALEVDESRPVRLIRSAEKESWDSCVKVYDPATGGAFHVFFDDKSSIEFNEAQGGDAGSKFVENPDFVGDPRQYAHTKAVLGPSRPFFYVYRSTYVGLTSRVLPATPPDEANLPSRCMVLGREDTLALLGPFSEIYQTARAAAGEAWSKANKTGKAKKGAR